jgi:predicted nucleotidyltransferase
LTNRGGEGMVVKPLEFVVRGGVVWCSLRSLMLKTAGLVDVLADAIKPLLSKIGAAFVYGSIAIGEEQAESNTDLMVIGALSPPELALPLRRASELLGREINATFYTPAEFAKKRANKDQFLTRALNKPKLFVVGTNDSR